MATVLRAITMAVALALTPSSARAQDAQPLCPVDSVMSGTVCIDKYEASVWRVPAPTTVNAGLVNQIQLGTATAADLAAGDATQLGTFDDDYAPCEDSGQNCASDVFAVSLLGVRPSANITWFQAQQACKNARKRLPTNAEWQAAVAGTPDPGPDDGTSDCNTSSVFDPVDTGSRSRCVSSDGAFDMVGNLYEWVADWVPRSTVCGAWSEEVSPTGDQQCLAGAGTTGEPAALLRGGSFVDGAFAGPLAIGAGDGPSVSFDGFGFRCARAVPEPSGVVQLGVGLAALSVLARRARGPGGPSPISEGGGRFTNGGGRLGDSASGDGLLTPLPGLARTESD